MKEGAVRFAAVSQAKKAIWSRRPLSAFPSAARSKPTKTAAHWRSRLLPFAIAEFIQGQRGNVLHTSGCDGTADDLMVLFREPSTVTLLIRFAESFARHKILE
ncbi:hypothetical protein F183_A29050 [Bryobacterales bacterium F-183]|nr:hypothetical protein F183_A29050 [Bryobacterales bacterium F-183]